MKTGFIAISLLCLAAHSLAQVDGYEGVQCVHKCLGWDIEDTSIARSAFHQTNLRSSALVEDPRCQETGTFLTCVEGCPVNRYITLARETMRIHEKYCGDNVNEATKEKFISDVLRFQAAWQSERQKCVGGGTDVEEMCREGAACVFGSSLTAAERGFDSDVVSLSVNTFKISYAAALEPENGGNLPSSCDLIFQPEQGSNYPAYPPYPSYESSSYQPYQRNNYQPYQRNNYQHHQRNSYQHYQRNSYQYKHRSGY